MGALALNDIWFGGQTMNPWLPEEGASGSSAGPGSATAAGLVGFSIGSETGGQHRQSIHALRSHRTSSDVRPRAANGSDDALLVPRQTRADDSWRGRRAARVARDLGTRPRRHGQCSQPSRLRCNCQRARSARRLLPCLDERAPRNRHRSRRARNRQETWHGPSRSARCRTGPTIR